MSVRQTLHQPRPFYLIFFLELWERFGYYGVSALLVLYMVQSQGLCDREADEIYGVFSALVFLLPALGGYIGDHILGTRRTIVLGAVVLTLGYSLLAIPMVANAAIMLPLAIIAVGNGLFKPNPASLMSKIYERAHLSADSGFTLYYMAINVGALFGIILAPQVMSWFGWHAGFGVAAIGLSMGLLTYASLRHWISELGSAPDFNGVDWMARMTVYLGIIAAVGLCYLSLIHRDLVIWVMMAGIGMVFTFYFIALAKSDAHERGGMYLFFALFMMSLIFYVLYFQMPMSLTLFAARNVEHSLLGIPIQPASFWGLNPFWIIVLSPLLAILFRKLELRGLEPSMPMKFTIGTFSSALAFLSLPLGMQFAEAGIVSSNWLILAYALQSFGEIMIAALGLSMVSRLIPQRLMGFAMGLWLLNMSIGSIIAGRVAGMADISVEQALDPTLSLPIYQSLFTQLGLVTLGAAVVMFAIVPLLKRWQPTS